MCIWYYLADGGFGESITLLDGLMKNEVPPHVCAFVCPAVCVSVRNAYEFMLMEETAVTMSRIMVAVAIESSQN